MVDQQNAESLIAQLAQQFGQFQDLGLVATDGRFVEDQDSCVRRKRSRQFQSFGLTVGKTVGRPKRFGVESAALHLHDRFCSGAAVAQDCALQDGERAKRDHRLKRSRYSQARDPVRTAGRDINFADKDLPAIGDRDTGYAIDQSRLSASIGADQRVNGPGLNLNGDIVNGDDTTVGLRETLGAHMRSGQNVGGSRARSAGSAEVTYSEAAPSAPKAPGYAFGHEEKDCQGNGP